MILTKAVDTGLVAVVADVSLTMVIIGFFINHL